MPYTLEVLIEKRVILETCTGHYSSEESASAVTELVKFLDTCEGKNGILLGDITRMKTIDNNLIKMRDTGRQLFYHPNHLLSIGWGQGGDRVVISFLANMLAGLFKQPMKTFPTEQEAIQYIVYKCPELAESLPRSLKAYHERMTEFQLE